MRTYQVRESEYPIGNELYEPSYDLVNIGNTTERYIVEPGAFELGELVHEDEFAVEPRHYTDGTYNEHGNYAVRLAKQHEYKLYVTIAVKVWSHIDNVGDLIDSFQSNSNYGIESTEDVTVLDTEWVRTDRTF